MVKRMLIDGTHSEETRVVVMNGTRLEDFDVETSTKRQIKGNVYLAKVIRVEPSLQAAFVDYGGNRHGFLAFSEIHPDYYQIPVADRERLMAETEEDAETETHVETATEEAAPEAASDAAVPEDAPAEETAVAETDAEAETAEAQAEAVVTDADAVAEVAAETAETSDAAESDNEDSAAAEAPVAEATETAEADEANAETADEQEPEVEQVGGEDPVESSSRRVKPHRQYKIQEVIKRKQILLVQVVKEERGNKGAALTTYLSLAGRYCVLMPNTPRGGGVSRKITNVTDRRRLKDMMSGLEIPKGMAVIVRTAGSERSKTEIKRDYEYLLRTWSGIRNLTMESRAPALVYEEANLIKRAIRDIYTRDIDEILVEGDEGYRMAKDFMKALTPSHAKKVQPYRDSNHMPLFHRYQVENQLEALHNTEIHLKSGGYIVMQQTEALVSVDVNSGRSTRERNIEETALKTNLEAADEIARQLRLRDLAGLVVIDYIDMEDPKNNSAVERRTKDALRSDRARIQVGRISPFGLMELSRQRLRPSFMESSYITCPHCKGEGVIRSTESEVVRILRVIEEEGVRRRSAEITVTVPTNIALYILNQKRSALASIEARYGFVVTINGSDTMGLGELTLERTRALTRAESEALQPPPMTTTTVIEDDEDDVIEEEAEEVQVDKDDDDDEDGRKGKRRRRKRRGKKGERDDAGSVELELNENGTVSISDDDDINADNTDLPNGLKADDNAPKKSRRRGRRGGRRRNKVGEQTQTVEQINAILEETAKDQETDDPVLTAFVAEQEALAARAAAEPEAEEAPRRGKRGPKRERRPAKDKTAKEKTEKPARRGRKPKTETEAAEVAAETAVQGEATEVTVTEEPKAEAKVIPIVTIDNQPEEQVRQTLIEPQAAAETTEVAKAEAPTEEHVMAAPVMAKAVPLSEIMAQQAAKAPEAQAEPALAAVASEPEPVAQAPKGPARKGWWSR